jgi:hypothetical protein
MNLNSPVQILNSEDRYLKVLEETNQYFREHEDIAKEINDHIWIMHDLLDLIPETVEKFFSGHTFPLMESQYEIEASIAFCMQGFYKHSMIALRNALELGLMSVYWDVDDKSEVDIQSWLKSVENTPFRKNISKRLLQHKHIFTFNEQVHLIDYIDKVYGLLSDFGHTKGAKFSSRGLGRSNVNTFYDKSLHLWLRLFKQVIQIIAVVHICKYPIGFQFTPLDDKFGLNGPAGGFLNPHQSNRIKQNLNEDWNKVLQKISDSDDEAVGASEWVNQKPDITQEEFDKQAEDFDKETIRAYVGGFKGWLKNEKHTHKYLKDKPDQYKKQITYLKKMRIWAKNQKII